MGSVPNIRSSLDYDDEFANIEDKFADVERSLNKSCELLEAQILKISVVKDRIQAAYRAGSYDVARILNERLEMLRRLYKVYYVISEQQSDQLLFLDNERQRQPTPANSEDYHEDFTSRQ